VKIWKKKGTVNSQSFSNQLKKRINNRSLVTGSDKGGIKRNRFPLFVGIFSSKPANDTLTDPTVFGTKRLLTIRLNQSHTLTGTQTPSLISPESVII